MRALVTGATGFVGANLARRLLGDGHAVHLLVRPGSDRWRLSGVDGELRFHEASLADRPALDRLLAALRPDWVFHLAVYGAYPHQGDLDTMLATNVVGTANLLRAAAGAGVSAFVNAGSSSEYGLKRAPPAEDAYLDPNSYYAATKASATLLCRQISLREDIPAVTLRLYSAFGPYEEPTRLIPTLVARGLRGELPPLVDPATARDYVYVDDVVDAFLLAAIHAQTVPGAVYNVGSGVQTTLREVVEVAKRVLAVTAEPAWGTMPARGWDSDVWVADSRLIRRALGWAPRRTFEAGFEATVTWLRANPALAQRYGRR